MGKGLIIAVVVVIVVAAIAAYMFLGPSAPYTLPVTTGGEETGATAAETTIDEAGATATANQAEGAASEAAGEIGAADNMEVPDVQ